MAAAPFPAFGCDVASVDHDTIDYKALKASGRSFLIPRGEYAYYADPDFSRHFKGAHAAGMVAAAYEFPRFSDPIEPQARKFFEIIEAAGYPNGTPGQITGGAVTAGYLAPFFDLERLDGVDPKTAVDKTRIWGEMARDRYAKNLEWRAGLYSSYRVLELETLHGVDLSQLVPLFDLWLAYYSGPGVTPPVPLAWGGNGKANGTGDYLIHQYGGDAQGVPGVSGKIDVNLFNGMAMGFPKSGMVKRYQRMLNGVLKPATPLVADGLFGDKTRRTTVDYQKLRGLQQDGACGVYTWAKITHEAW